MRWLVGIILVAGVAGGCRSGPEPRQYELVGQILSVNPARQEVVIRHKDIKGFMPGMTMPFKVEDRALLDGRQPGDLVTATLVVGEVEAHLSALTKTGSAPLPEAVEVTAADGAVLQVGDLVPDQQLLDQDGRSRALSSFHGRRVALTFTYTRCPLPDFCPLMDRNFAAVQKTIQSTPELRDVQLVSVSFDPAFDTPAVLKAHATTLGADPAIWTFATGSEDELATLTRRFGVIVERDTQQPIEITHNLRTAVIDAEGRIAVVHAGTDWTPAQLVADLKTAAAASH